MLKTCEKYPLDRVPVNIILFVGKCKSPLSITKIVKVNEITFSYGVKVISYLHSLGIIEIKKEGKEKRIKLTEKGQKIYGFLLEVFKVLHPEEDVYLF